MTECYEGWTTSGNTKGRCCCNCKWQVPIVGHPWNTGEMHGSIRQIKGYGCTVPISDTPSEKVIVFFEFKHSMCEMHDPKDPNG